MNYNVGIIGSGPGGYSAAFEAAKYGLTVVIYEKGEVGGTCLNRGCIPTKSLLHSTGLYWEVISSASNNGTIIDKARFDYAIANKRKEAVVTSIKEGLTHKITSKSINIVYGSAKILDEHSIVCNEEVNTFDNIVIATGSKTFIPPIEGATNNNVLTSDSFLELDKIDFSSICIIGGGVIAVEFANILSDIGVQVTILEMASNIIPNMDAQLSIRLKQALTSKGVQIINNANVSKITGEKNVEVIYNDNQIVNCERVLIATGRIANIDDLFDQDVIINSDRRGIIVNNNNQTNLPTIFAIGDCVSGNIQLAHVAMAQGKNVIDYIMHQPASVCTNAIASCIYTKPQIASVGLSDKQAKALGINCQVKKSLLSANGKSVVIDELKGYVSVVVDKDTDLILGAQFMCSNATEMIGIISLAINSKITYGTLISTIIPHPTVAETIIEGQ